MNILFCNIAWMKYYNGVTKEDKPINGGSYVDENGYAYECFNFRDYNGKCYGFVEMKGDMALELHYKDVKKHQSFIKDVLVIWVATNDKNETRIVGWYKNATVYRQEQCIQSFVDKEWDLFYRIEALAKDCYLVPEEQRTFPIQRAAQTGKGTGMGRSSIWYGDSEFAKTKLIPKIIEYIDNYNGKLANVVFTDEMLSKVIENKKISNDFEKLLDEGIKHFNEEDYKLALKFFNTARLIEETPEVLFCIADTLLALNCFDKSIPIFQKVINIEGDNTDTIQGLILCYDGIANREKTIEYCSRIVSLLESDDSEEAMEDKFYYSCTIFDIYVFLGDEKNARAIINEIPKYVNDDEAKIVVENMKNIIKENFEL